MENNPYDPMGEERRSEYHMGDAPFQFPLWAIIAGFVVWWPLGVIFIALNASARRKDNTLRVNGESAPGPIYTAPPRPRKKPAVTAQGSEDKSEKWGKLLLLIGGVLLAAGLLSVTWDGAAMITALLRGGPWWYMLQDVLAELMLAGGGIGALYAGWVTRTSGRMRKKIANIVGNADYMYVRDIAGAISCSEAKCRRHLENCIDKGVFGPQAYLDMRTNCLVVRGKAPTPEKARPQPAAEEKNQSEYERILQQLRQINDAVEDTVMSNKIDRLEAVSARIFDQARTNPEKLPQMRKFMDYYLPTALKLLKTYAELDAQGVEGDNIRLSKQRIEQAMDTLVVAFENQLDQLFRADAMDVSADIEVMEQMLRADGLTGGDPFRAGQPPQAPHLEL